LRPKEVEVTPSPAIILALFVVQAVAPSEPVRIDHRLRQPKQVKSVAPKYPDQALKAGFAGVVIVEATVSADGRVTAEVLSSENTCALW
jgi:outer membrane biosynthesis protein TonB